MAAERFHATQALGQTEDAQVADEGVHIGAVALEVEGDHAAEVAHLARGERVIGMRR
jgi:hypothetical protein